MRSFHATLIALCTLTTPTLAQIVYVDANATPPGNGTQASPFVTITQAMNVLGGLTTASVHVAPGTYVENVVCAQGATRLLATGGPLVTTIVGASAGPVVTMPAWCDCKSDAPIVEGFTISGVSGPFGTAAVTCDEGTVRGCILTANTGNGYFAYACTGFGQMYQTTIAGNDNGIRTHASTGAIFEKIAFDNPGANYTHVSGFASLSNSVGLALPAATNNQVVEPGFWNPATGDYHLLPNAPARTVPGGYAGALPYDANYSPDSFAFCSGDAAFVDHTTACPCGNAGSAGHGCASGFNANGAQLVASGVPQLDDVVLSASGMSATALGVYLQHDANGDQVFHDGVICAGGNLLRLRVRAANGGVSSFPDPAFPIDATTTLSQRGGVAPGSGATRFYSVFYRAPVATFCPPATANVTNGWRVTW